MGPIKDNNIKKMAELLRTGYTMLNLACPICKDPIFRNKEKELFCPTCERKVMIVEDEKLLNNSNLKEEELTHKIEASTQGISKSNEDVIKGTILEKIQFISQKLKSETQIDIIDKYTRILLNLYNLLDRLH